MKNFKLTVSTPDGHKFSGDVVKLDVRGVLGDLAVMAGHIPFVTSLVKCPCTIWISEDEKRTATCDGGLLTVGADAVTLLAGSFKFD